MNSKQVKMYIPLDLYEKLRKYSYFTHIDSVPKACLYLIQHDMSIDTALSDIEKQVAEEQKQD